MRRLASALRLALAGLFVCSATVAQDAPLPLVPWPQHVAVQDSHFTVSERTRIGLSNPADPELQRLGRFVSTLIENSIGYAPIVVGDTITEAAQNVIALVLDPTAGTGAEGYRLDITPGSVTVRASAHAGIFYGLQTFRQLLPADAETPPPARTNFRTPIPAVEIFDAPRFSYRGMHLDVVRHFFPLEFVKEYIDLLALYKFNRFHWHLTDDQGWRIEIKRYPKLTEVGGFRKETLIGHFRDRPRHFDGQRHGGFFTQEEAREIVRYAAERYITVIPEIEMPGHATAALAAYPELGCTEGPIEVATLWGVFEDIFCPKEETFTFLENVLAEVMEIFPSEYIHIGGDEAPKKRWEESDAAQEVIRREGLADEHELQSYFVRRIERFLNENGRKLIGWDEIIEGGLSPTATVMYWRNWGRSADGVNSAKLAASQGNNLIMTPNATLYFDHYQADPAGEPLGFGGSSSLAKVYAYEPIPEDFTPEEATHVLGAQANVWAEYIRATDKIEYMVFPRLLALSEVVWSPAATRDWDFFLQRLPHALERLDALEVNYRPLDP